jgi:D-glycero-D-manno-heptose 1,7-bisphosphate phosphatase
VALRAASEAGFEIVIVSNQSAVGRGLLEAAQVVAVHRSVLATLEREGVRIRASYLCPHAPDAACPCRKPAPGMITAALDESGVHPDAAAFVGDAYEDMQAAARANVSPVLVRTGRGARHEPLVRGDPHLRHAAVVADLAEAISIAAGRVSPGASAPSTDHRSWNSEVS